MKIVAISDTHDKHNLLKLPPGDVLIHSGDITNRGRIDKLEDFANWLNVQDFKHKIIVCGNHDFCFQDARHNHAVALIHEAGGTYLQDSEIVIDDIKFWGSPWQPWFYNWAFNAQRGAEIAEKWDLIPENTNVLITHGPPHGILDLIEDDFSDRDRHQGCEELRKKVDNLQNLKLHVFGHLHYQGGNVANLNSKIFANAAICDDRHNADRQPLVIEI